MAWNLHAIEQLQPRRQQLALGARYLLSARSRTTGRCRLAVEARGTGATRADAVLRASATISRRAIFPNALLGSSVAPDVASRAEKLDD